MVADQVDSPAVSRNAQGVILHTRAPADVSEDENLHRDGLLGRRGVLDVAGGKKGHDHQHPGYQPAKRGP